MGRGENNIQPKGKGEEASKASQLRKCSEVEKKEREKGGQG